ncbi:MAG: hypothetical protein LRY46_02660 [Candidatus Pacebacteria bacterium]|nr:hypothetical protein [Candidatus Paceibacterota bacterium]MCD8507885.1 hypothetical protein [Candidatus Paceibacterota bacterium]
MITKRTPFHNQGDDYARLGTESLCYFRNAPAAFEMYDRSWLILNLSPENITGLYVNEPSMTDSRHTEILNLESLLVHEDMLQADLTTRVTAEGMTTIEQFFVRFNALRADIAFGEMEYRSETDDYLYRNPGNLFWQNLNTIPCDDLDDHIIVTDYVRKNIATIAPVDAVHGGTWYVTAVTLDPSTQTGMVRFEDGHILESLPFAYDRAESSVRISWDLNL